MTKLGGIKANAFKKAFSVDVKIEFVGVWYAFLSNLAVKDELGT
jgi:hypothetical protein